MSLTGDEKLIDAHKTQLKLPIHKGLVASNRTGPPLVELFMKSQSDLSSMFTGVLEKHIALVFAAQLHDAKDHWLELRIFVGEKEIR